MCYKIFHIVLYLVVIVDLCVCSYRENDLDIVNYPNDLMTITLMLLKVRGGIFPTP